MRAHFLKEEQAFLRYLEVPGDDPPVIWIHGWQCSSTAELAGAAVQPVLAGRRSLLVDLLGHGYSDRPPDFGYTLRDHARTVVDLIDGLGISRCTLVGHSMGGGVAIHVASMRPTVVASLVMAEGTVDPAPPSEDDIVNQSEDSFVAEGYDTLLADQTASALASPDGISAQHVGITRAVDPRALYREEVSMCTWATPTHQEMLGALTMRRTYLAGALSSPEPEFDIVLDTFGIAKVVIPDTGHAMGLQNPLGLAVAVAGALATT
jgi:pimeloyl-ACP methyl ester carboxylesterase